MRRPGNRGGALRFSAALCLMCITTLRLAASVPAFKVAGAGEEAWNKIFSSVGIAASHDDNASIVVADPQAGADMAKLAAGHILILEGDSAAARALGIVPQQQTVSVRHIVDSHAPDMQIIWQQQAQVPMMTVPADFRVFARERWKNDPVEAGKRTANGAILWLATDPGKEGTERYPYLLQALTDLGLDLTVRSADLWAFFDSAYRSRADVDYLARRWRQAGISVIHAAGWHNMEPDAQRDEYLKNVIAACHRNAILVYAWLELPHVSDEFWREHPEWREKTALGEDAQLDWRKLMNLQNAQCKRAVSEQVSELLQRFDWDGVNLAELYFESLEGSSNPARFTPMNDDVRREFRERSGIDPKLLFDQSTPASEARRPDLMRSFLDYRAALASQMQSDWLGVLARSRAQKPWLDVVVTHIDDRLEPGMRDSLGADTARSLPFIQARRATLLVEDPATLWNLGAARYGKLADKYAGLPLGKDKLAVDINVVERYQDVYPTKKQTGVELCELVHEAARRFPQVAIYFESSVEGQDLSLLASAAANATVSQPSPDQLIIDSGQSVRVSWAGPAELDGKPWPVQNATSLLIPAGHHRIGVGMGEPAMKLSDFNGAIQTAVATSGGVELSYTSATRAIAAFASPVSSVDVDGVPYWTPDRASDRNFVMLPAGEHVVDFHP
jgi:hypothetical protein